MNLAQQNFYTEKNRNSQIPGFGNFLQGAEKRPSYKVSIQLFEQAVLAHHFISVTEQLKYEDQQNPRVAAMTGNAE